MGHDHSHGGGHSHAGHAHAVPKDFGPVFALAVGLNLSFVLIEGIVGVSIGSVALVADAGHNASDVLGLLLAWGAVVLTKARPDGRYTYGLGSASILAALANAALLLIAAGVILWEAIGRLSAPSAPDGWIVMGVAAIGVVINFGTALLFMKDRKSDLNLRGAFLHMAFDGLVSLGVIVAGCAILLTGAGWIDPVIGVVIALVIVWGGWGLMRDSIALAMNAAPPATNLTAIDAFLRARSGVASVHDLHVWPLSTTQTVLSAHLVTPDGHPGDVWLADLAHDIEDRFAINHVTIQIELDPEGPCNLTHHAPHGVPHGDQA
jgi:cobalt-zinc-cadmium efflux system protein